MSRGIAAGRELRHARLRFENWNARPAHGGRGTAQPKAECKDRDPCPQRTVHLIAALFGIVAAIGIAASPAAARTASPLGVWLTEGGKSHIEVYRCGSNMCGKVVWLNRAPSRGPALDKANPDPAKRGRPILGMRVLSDLKPTSSPREWTGGQGYDPRDGDSYKVKMTLLEDGRLRVRGYIGIPIIGRSQIWKRVK